MLNNCFLFVDSSSQNFTFCLNETKAAMNKPVMRQVTTTWTETTWRESSATAAPSFLPSCNNWPTNTSSCCSTSSTTRKQLSGCSRSSSSSINTFSINTSDMSQAMSPLSRAPVQSRGTRLFSAHKNIFVTNTWHHEVVPTTQACIHTRISAYQATIGVCRGTLEI